MKYIFITITNETKTYSERLNYKEYEEEFKKAKSNGSNQELENINFLDYCKEVVFEWNDKNLQEFNGNHLIYGYLECLDQSDDIPIWIVEAEENEEKLMVKIE